MKFIIFGSPRTKKNHSMIVRKRGKQIIIPSNQSRGWTNIAVPQLMSQLCANPIDYPINLCAIIYRDKNVGDLINYLQAICDVLEDAGIVDNDKWILAFDGSRATKDANNPRVEIEITELQQDSTQ